MVGDIDGILAPFKGCACKNAVILTRKGETPLVKHDFDIGEKKLTLYAAAEPIGRWW